VVDLPTGHGSLTTPGWLAPGVRWLAPLALAGGAPPIPLASVP
jgi:hypothetical protein